MLPGKKVFILNFPLNSSDYTREDKLHFLDQKTIKTYLKANIQL